MTVKQLPSPGVLSTVIVPLLQCNQFMYKLQTYARSLFGISPGVDSISCTVKSFFSLAERCRHRYHISLW
ncbi:MAG: hypothetical protein R2758_17155 [Bacteroidales bacterium]